MPLQGLGIAHARPVDWAPAAETLRAIMDGTNLFAVASLMQALTMTEISPELAEEEIGDGRYVLAYLHSPNRASAFRRSSSCVRSAGRTMATTSSAGRSGSPRCRDDPPG